MQDGLSSWHELSYITHVCTFKIFIFEIPFNFCTYLFYHALSKPHIINPQIDSLNCICTQQILYLISAWLLRKSTEACSEKIHLHSLHFSSPFAFRGTATATWSLLSMPGAFEKYVQVERMWLRGMNACTYTDEHMSLSRVTLMQQQHFLRYMVL
jgi:hypothetical protein